MLGQAVRYVLVGLTNTVIGLSAIFVLSELLKVDPYIANGAGYCLGLLSSFVLNKRWTFRHDGGSVAAFWRFLAVIVVAYAANVFVLHLLLRAAIVPPFAAQIGGVAVYTVAGFFGMRAFAFR